MQPPDFPTLPGYRRELMKESFEDIARLQTSPAELLGYFGVTERKLRVWCRAVYGRSLDQVISDVRADGRIEIRRAAFDQMKKNATLIERQFSRYLPAEGAGAAGAAGDQAKPEAFLALSAPGEQAMAEIFGPPPGGGEGT